MTFDSYLKEQKLLKYLSLLSIVVGITFFLVGGFHATNYSELSAFHPMRNTAEMIGLALILSGIVFYRSRRKILRNQDHAKEKFVKENDEYQAFIESKASLITIILAAYLFAIGAAIAWFYNLTVSATLLASFLGLIILYLLTVVYHRFKH